MTRDLRWIGSYMPGVSLSLDFAESEALAALRHEARELASAAVNRFGAWNDSWISGFSKEFSAELGDRGWIGLTWPVEFGGGGRPPIERMVIAEELIAAGAPIAGSWFADRQMGPSLIAFGTTEQQRRFLPGIIAGRDTWCIGMSEPGAGSDLASVSTKAVRDGSEFVISGQKIWTSGAAGSDYCYLICRTSTVPQAPHQGISEIIVPMDTPGIEIKPIRDMIGNQHFCEVFYDEVRVPVDNLVGNAGSAFKQSMRQLEHERGGIDRLVSNLRSYRTALDLADLRDPVVRQKVAELETGYRIGRFLVTREVLGQAPAGFSAATKIYCTSHEQRVAQFIAFVLGPDACIDVDLTREMAYAPAYTIMGGTSDVLRNILAERLLGLPK
jgi:alkylation response protein AidB-like acyl-CoA dehydrogenase